MPRRVSFLCRALPLWRERSLTAPNVRARVPCPFIRASAHQKRDTKNGPRRPRAGMALHRPILRTETKPYPGNAAVPRRFERGSHISWWGPGLAGWGGRIRTCASASSGRSAATPSWRAAVSGWRTITSPLFAYSPSAVAARRYLGHVSCKNRAVR
jgi:hypothetical protein